jgi:exonuclease III
MRLLTWNVAGRVKSAAAQVDAIGEFDVVCLQEITPTSRATWIDALTARGLHVAVSDHVAPPRGSRRLAVLIASRSPLEVVAGPPELPWPERHLAVVTDGVEVHTLHAPLSSKEGGVKVRTLEALFAALAERTDVPRIVCGDFNTPAYESRAGEIQTFARTRAGNIRPQYGERHDRAELLLIDELPRRGWRDAFRALHGYGARDRSYMFANRKFGWRLDHIVVSPEIEPLACEYIHEWRERGLSDHSALWAELGLAS